MATVEPHPKAFFRVYIPLFCEVRMQFPLLWTNDLPEAVSMSDIYGNIWQLKTEKEGRHWYFTDGWIQFVYDNGINVGDLIAFYLIEDGLFRFRLFDGKDECGKKGFGGLRIQEDEEDDDVKEVNGFDYLSEESSLEEDRDLIEVTHTRQTRKHKTIVDIYGGEFIRTGKLNPVPRNPYFLTRFKSNRASELYIPKKFLKDHGDIQLPEELILVEPQGRKYNASLKMWNNGRTFYKGGWKSLCKSNGLTPEDVCVCQFVQGEEGIFMEVSFIRAGRG